tara:strand:+ start:1613 stop:8398 length:6786 start_codon:yes stop_codon:yes gene_type:complete
MAKEEVDIGIEGNDGTGDSIRESFKKVNQNFTELYAVFGLGGTIAFKSLDDVPSTYLGNESAIPAIKTDATGVGFYKFVSDSGANNNTKTAGVETNNSVFLEFDDVDPATPNESGTLKITIVDPHVNRDPDPNFTAPLNAEAVMAYSNTINTKLRNVGAGDTIANLVANWNTTHSGAASITEANVVISRGYADDRYVNVAGDTMSGALSVPSSAAGTQVPQTQEVITRAGSVTNRTMLDTLYLADHPSPLEGFGQPNGSDDLQAVTKLYVDTQGYASTTNLFVSTQGDDSQSVTPPGQEGRSFNYAYRSINAAMTRATEIIAATPYEPGPYVQTITHTENATNSVINTISGVVSPLSTSTAAAALVDSNIVTIKQAVLTYINTTYPNLVYNEDICARDVGLILDSVKLDVQAGASANYLSRWAGIRYNANPSAVKAKTLQYEATADGIDQARDLILQVFADANTATPGTVDTAVINAYNARMNEILEYIDSDPTNDNPLVTGNSYVFEISNGGNAAVDQGVEGNKDLIEGKVIRGRTSGALGVIVDYIRAFSGSTDKITVDLLEPKEFIAGEELEYGNRTRSNQITVFVETGIYYEHMPIKLPENVSIKGDEFRRCVIRPKPGVSQSRWANAYFYRDINVDGLIAAQSPISTIGSIGAADAARVAGTYSVTDYATTGIGEGATFSVVVDGSGAATVTVVDVGDGFIVGETITIDDSDLGTGGGANLTFNITATGGGYHFTHPINTEQGKYGYHYLTDSGNPVSVSSFGATNPGDFYDAAKLIEKNKAFITEEVIEYIAATYPSLSYNETKCRRDTGLVLDGIVNDFKVGGREVTLTNQGAYYGATGVEAETEQALAYIKTIAANVLANNSLSPFTALGAVSQVFDIALTAEAGSSTQLDELVDCVTYAFDPAWNPPLNNSEMDVFLCNDGTIVRNMTLQRHGGFMMVLDPEGQILTRSPYCQTGASFSQSKGTKRSFAGGMFMDGYAGNMPATITAKASSYRLTIQSPAGEGLYVRRPPTPFPFFLNGARYTVNTITNYNQATGSCDVILDETSNPAATLTYNITAATRTNPVVITTDVAHGRTNGDIVTIVAVAGMTQLNGNNYYVSVVDSTSFSLYSDAGLTIAVDGTSFNTYTGAGVVKLIGSGSGYLGGTGVSIFLQSGGNRSMLSNDFTQVNDLGYGAIATNNALSELVSMFTYYCYTGYLALKGSNIRSLGGNNSYGFYGLVSEGSDPDEVATDVTLATNMVFAGKTFKASHIIKFSSAVPGSVLVGETISQEITGATAVVSFFMNGRKDVYCHTIDGNWNTSDQAYGDDSTTLLGVPTVVDNIAKSANVNSLFMYAYDLTGLPTNVSEVEILHDSGLYQPYEITNASQENFILDSFLEVNDTIGATYTGSSPETTKATFTITKDRRSGYGVVVEFGGLGYAAGETFLVDGADLNGVSSTNDATITITTVVGGVITAASISGTPLYDDNTPVLDGQVWRFNYGTGIEGTASNGLQEETLHDTNLVIRQKQNFLFDGVNSLPTRPSTAVVFTDDTSSYTYRSIAFTKTITDGYLASANQSVITFDANFRYIDLTTSQDHLVIAENSSTLAVRPGYTDIITDATPSGAKHLGELVGDRFIAINTLDNVEQGRLAEGEVMMGWGGKDYIIEAYSEYTYTPAVGAAVIIGVLQISDIVNTDVNWPATASGLAAGLLNAAGITLKGGLISGEAAQITVNISTTRATGHDMLDIGVGGYNTANYPERVYGAPYGLQAVSTSDAIDSTGNASAAQVQERNKGRVFAVLTDQDGFFRVGRFFTVDQGTGSVTFNAALVLTNIDGIGFKRGVRVNEFSADDTFTDPKGDAVPTQTAVEGYLDARLGMDRNGSTAVTNIGPGVMSLGGPGFAETPMVGNMNLGSNRITNLVPNIASASDAATIGYVDSKTDQLNDIGDVTLESTISPADVLIFTGTFQESENANIIGDIAFTRSNPNEITASISSGVIVDNDVSTTADIGQGKLLMNLATATASAPTGTAAAKQGASGLTSFDSANFEITDGWVGIKAGGVSNGELANSTITLGTTAVSLGGTVSTLAGVSGITFTSGGITGPAGITHTGNILGGVNSGADNGQTVGSAANQYNAMWATVFHGTATEALYADLAENYLGDAEYDPGTVLILGGEQEVTVTDKKGDRRIAGVVSTNPAHLMNSALVGDHVVALALQGRVPCKVIGKVAKGDLLVTSAVPGYAIVDNDPKVGTVIGKAVGTKDDMDRGVVEVVVGRV